MNIDKIKLDLVKLIKHKKNVTLIDIENYFDEINFDYKGDFTISKGHENLIIWDNWNSTASSIIQELLKSELIEMKPTDEILYYKRKKILLLPVYKGYKPYKQWLPVEFN